MTPLKKRLLTEIASNGPMRLEAYMQRALADPEHGYYMQRRPFGKTADDGGDFITAPEVSQMFGELIGAWLADLWQRMGQPEAFCLVELGPGRGTLMADILRAAAVLPEFAEAAQVHFVETSEALRAAQKHAVPDATWHNDISTLPPLPGLLVANEFFDALPIQQYRKTAKGWVPIMVSASETLLQFSDGAEDDNPFSTALMACLPTDIPDAAIIETSMAVEGAMTDLCQHISEHGGAALLIDYGHAAPAYGDSFQAMRGHGFVDPLAEPGLADLTAHVNFPLLAHIAKQAGLTASPIAQQGPFLETLGLSLRAQQLMQMSQGREMDIQAERHRLAAPQEMGSLFKVLAVAHENMPPLVGFAEGLEFDE